MPPTVIAFGGNALVREGEHGTQRVQTQRATELALQLVPLLEQRCPLLLVHGNGPQVGDELSRVEEAVTKVPPLSLDMCVAATAGTVGVLLERALRNQAREMGADLQVATLVTLVRVEADEAAGPASKPVGAHFTRYRAEALQRNLGWEMVETSSGSWRRVVSSPRPAEVLNVGLLRRALVPGMVVIAGGGGGVPVALNREGRLVGVEAVVDKDHVAGLLATAVEADRLLILTSVDHVHLDHGKPTQRSLEQLHPDEAWRLLAQGQFPAGSMGPKVEAAARFVSQTGRAALITSPERLHAALEGSCGTRIEPEGAPEAGRGGSGCTDTDMERSSA